MGGRGDLLGSSFEKMMTHEELHNLRGHGLEGGMGSSWVESEQAFHVCVGASLGESEHEFVLVGK